ncbi:MAG TPA: DUF4190 domain-containing protein [Blastocatellia bacterium]|nr:DUF4190 domain-containing protein [Blastocatellia bacterium]
MSFSPKHCRECGLPLNLGLAQCPRCGARVGTLFSDRPGAPSSSARDQVGNTIGAFQAIEEARERANNSLVLALASFFCPVLGIAVGSVAIWMGANAIQTLKAHRVEEGRGPAWAGIIISGFAIVAQIFVSITLVRQGSIFGL